MNNPTINLIKQRVSTNRFDATHVLSNAEVEALICLATRAPTAYNLQNWRFIAVRKADAKVQLRRLAHGQVKVQEAAVTFIICGVLPDPVVIPERLRGFVADGFMSVEMASGWQEGAQAQYADPQVARDEAVRSASLAAATLMYAAGALGLASAPMVGFDAQGVAHGFGLGPTEVPVMLVAIGRAAPGNWPQKPRRPIAEVLEIS